MKGTFTEICINIVRSYANEHLDKTDGIQITNADVYAVWTCKTLQNFKGLFSTTLPDGMYYEVTYNGDKAEFYLDAYKKFENRLIGLANAIATRDASDQASQQILRSAT